MKQRITVTIDSDSYQLLKSADVNISALVNRAMQNEARRLRAERWQAENQEGMAEVARFIEMNGSFADENRDCSGQLKLATVLEFFQYRFSDSFGGNPPL